MLVLIFVLAVLSSKTSDRNPNPSEKTMKTLSRTTRRNCVRLLLILTAATASLPLTTGAAPSQQEAITIHPEKTIGPALGTFSASGAFSDSGILVTESRLVTAIPSPFGVVTHLVLRFEGKLGTFTVRAQIIETVTPDDPISLNEGVWVIVDGTGAYSTLHGTGDVEGIVDDDANLITRAYTGTVHLK